MNKMKFIKTILTGTLLSILVFFAISFLTILIEINPIHLYKNGEPYRLDIGFPFKYYEQFWLRGSEIPNSGWLLNNLIYDCLLTWIVITGIYILILKIKNNSH